MAAGAAGLSVGSLIRLPCSARNNLPRHFCQRMAVGITAQWGLKNRLKSGQN
jgi:hypothetical protein